MSETIERRSGRSPWQKGPQPQGRSSPPRSDPRADTYNRHVSGPRAIVVIPCHDEAARLVVREKMASISFLQRRMGVGFSRAGKLIDLMARDGLLGPPRGSKPREVLVADDYFEEVDRAPR